MGIYSPSELCRNCGGAIGYCRCGPNFRRAQPTSYRRRSLPQTTDWQPISRGEVQDFVLTDLENRYRNYDLTHARFWHRLQNGDYQYAVWVLPTQTSINVHQGVEFGGYAVVKGEINSPNIQKEPPVLQKMIHRSRPQPTTSPKTLLFFLLTNIS